MHNFTTEIRHSKTGEAKSLPDAQAVADFLASRQDADLWTGHEGLGQLPNPTGEAEPIAQAHEAESAAPEQVPTQRAPAEKRAPPPKAKAAPKKASRKK